MNKLSFFLFAITVFLSVVGLFLLYESSSYSAAINIGDRYYFIKYQAIWITVGIILALFVSKFSYRKLFNLALPILLVSFVLLIAVFIPGLGLGLKGAHRWIDLHVFVIQPSEFLKISLTLYLAAWFSIREQERLFAFLILFFVSVLLVALEPDMGTAMIVAVTSLVVYFLSGARMKDLLTVFFILAFGAVVLIKIAPYRVARLSSFQNFSTTSLADMPYHVKQILISLGSGGVSGVGFGNSIEKYSYLPENNTDSIFAIYAEESGFIGSVFLVGLFIVQIFLGFLISLKVEDRFGRLLSAGIVTFIGAQTLMNLCSQVVLIPLTGVPLPFVSYGGSSMIINFLSIGILMNIGNSVRTLRSISQAAKTKSFRTTKHPHSLSEARGGY